MREILRSLLAPLRPSHPGYPALMRRWFVFNLALAVLVALLYLSPILPHLLHLR